MTDRNPNRRKLEYEEIQNRKRRQLEHQREVQRRQQQDYDSLTDSQREQMEYRQRQRRKAEYRRRQEEQQKGSQKKRRNTQETATRPSGKCNSKNTQKTRNQKNRDNRRRKSVLGMILLVIQMLASCLFMFSLVLLDILPMRYLVIIAVVLAVLAFIVWLTQRRPKGRGIFGKVLSVFLSVTLLFGSFYVIKTNGLLSDVFGSNSKTNEMVVAVLTDDSAESIEDAAEYSFGVQYATGADSMDAVIQNIQDKLGTSIDMVEYASVQAQAQALMDGEVGAIIYNTKYVDLMEGAVSNFQESIKIIYKEKVTVNITAGSDNSVTITDPFTVYISGMDIYEGEEDMGSRSDVNIIATVNPKTHQILLVSTPRDFYVTIPGISDGEYDKLTHAGSYGVDVSIDTLENLYDVNIDFYARLNFTSLINIVDTLGGLDVYSEYSFTTSEDSGCVFDVSEGYNSLNGIQALAFARERQNVPGGDNQRGKDQQAVITAMIKKMLAPSMLIQANGLIDGLSGNVETSMSLDQMHGLVKSQLRTNAKWTITSVEPTGTYDSRYCYSAPDQLLDVTVPDEDTVAAIVQQINQVEAGESIEGAEQLN